ncbi:MAG: hypothetical protein QOJ00_1710 [Actinomycetota bacterium]
MAIEQQRRIDELVRRCYTGLDVAGLQREVLRRLREIVTVDAAFFATVDPVTMLFTSAISEDPLIGAAPLFLANELGREDVNRFTDVALETTPVRSLDVATDGDRFESERYAEIMRPLGLGDELRVALRSGSATWGVMCLHREDGHGGFNAQEVALVSRLAPHIGEGLRRATLAAGFASAPATAERGVVILDADGSVVSMNDEAERWLAQIPDSDWPASSELPLPIATVAAAAASSLPHSTLRVRTASDEWISVNASRVHGSDLTRTVVMIETAEPSQLTSLILHAHALTDAQSRVVALVLRGYSTQQIVSELRISANTVQEHLKAVFDKTGVRSRRELAAALMGAR